MAASNGGNVEGTVAGEAVITANGVTILGYTDLAGRLAAQASQLYGTNLVNLMKLMTPAKDGELVLDWDDVVQRGITVARDGEVTWPPPPVQVSAAPGRRRGRRARRGRRSLSADVDRTGGSPSSAAAQRCSCCSSRPRPPRCGCTSPSSPWRSSSATT